MNPLLSLQDAAKLLGVSLRQVRRYIDEGRLTVCRISERTVRVRPEDLASFISASTVQAHGGIH